MAATCIEIFITAKDAADQQFSTDLAKCNGSTSCQDTAVADHKAAIDAAYAAYTACRTGSGGGGSGS